MKTLYKTKSILLALAATVALGSCNSFLDTLPDKRMDLKSPEKIKALLVSAYPSVHSMGMLESRTDNVYDNGPQYAAGDLRDQEGYIWADITAEDFDSSKWYWDRHTTAIMTANEALTAIEELPDPSAANAAKGEALVIRAWAHFNMVNYFAQAYNSVTSGSDLGVPYITEPEKEIGKLYPRITVKATYEAIEKDLLEGLKYIDDSYYNLGAIKYHFNEQAAAAFAAQFYLYYEQWDKAVEYATKALGSSPAGSLRNLKPYAAFNSGSEVTNAFVNTAEPANIMLLNSNSLYARRYKNLRYSHARPIAAQTLNSPGPWGGSGLPDYRPLSRSYTAYPNALTFIYKYEEGWQVTDKRTGVGVPYTIAMPFTTDKTLLVRAEALVMLGRYDEAASDLSLYYQSKGGNAATASTISSFYNVPADYQSLDEAERELYEAKLEGIAKPLSPHFTLQEGMQYNLIQAVLHARRIETLWDGDRWHDIKRYRIVVHHRLYDGTVVTLEKDDPRRAMQLPRSVIVAGLAPNPTKA